MGLIAQAAAWLSGQKNQQPSLPLQPPQTSSLYGDESHTRDLSFNDGLRYFLATYLQSPRMWPVDYLLSSPYSPMQLEEIYPDHNWTDPFEDLLALENGNRMPDRDKPSLDRRLLKLRIRDLEKSLESNTKPSPNRTHLREMHNKAKQDYKRASDDLKEKQALKYRPRKRAMDKIYWMNSLIQRGAIVGWRVDNEWVDDVHVWEKLPGGKPSVSGSESQILAFSGVESYGQDGAMYFDVACRVDGLQSALEQGIRDGILMNQKAGYDQSREEGAYEKVWVLENPSQSEEKGENPHVAIREGDDPGYLHNGKCASLPAGAYLASHTDAPINNPLIRHIPFESINVASGVGALPNQTEEEQHRQFCRRVVRHFAKLDPGYKESQFDESSKITDTVEHEEAHLDMKQEQDSRQDSQIDASTSNVYKPSILSELTVIERTNLPDGTFTTNRVLIKRFSDGTEECSEEAQTGRTGED